ncbi:MAG: LamG domain-containing protein, partial [Candidatus Paceibacterota bacterium]
ASSTLLNSSGWLPIDFTSSIQSLPRLPIDPTNVSSTSLYYTYIANPTTQTYELTTILESNKYRLGGSADTVSTDGGSTSYLYEQGTNLTLHPITDAGLVGYWTFDEGTGTQALDSSGYGNTGILLGSPTWISDGGKINGSIRFNSLSDYINVGSNIILRPTTAFSLSFWFKPYSLNPATWYYFFGFSNWNTEFSLIKNNDVNNTLHFAVNTGTVTAVGKPNPFSSFNDWYHITVSYDGSFMKIYLNGVMTNDSAKTGLVVYGGTVAYIAKSYNDYLSGELDDFRFYNRALSKAEVLSIYNANK